MEWFVLRQMNVEIYPRVDGVMSAWCKVMSADKI